MIADDDHLPFRLGPDAVDGLLDFLSTGREERRGPRSIGGYEVCQVVGEGGSGVVYRVRRREPEHEFALKLYRQPVEINKQSERALRELEFLRDLDLDDVPKVHDFGIHDGRLYVVTDLVIGRPITKYAEAMDIRERVALIARLAEAIQRLHESGVIHRDLKPANVLITDAGEIRIVDFGLAVTADPEASRGLSIEGKPLGTWAYMAPEQARGEHRGTTTRCDVYSIGATAYRLLAGHPAYPLDTPFHDLVRQISNEEPPRLRSTASDLPTGLEAVVYKAMRLNAHQRYATAGAVAADLHNWLDGRPVTARDLTPVVRTLNFLSRHRWAAVIAVSLLVLTVLSTYFAGVAVENGRQVEKQREWAFKTIAIATSSAQAEEYGRAADLLEIVDLANPDQPDIQERVRAERVSVAVQISADLLGKYFEEEDQIDQLRSYLDQKAAHIESR